MSTSSTVNVGAEGDVFSEHHSTLPPPVTVLEASDIPKASAEALQLLKSFGKQYKLFNIRRIFCFYFIKRNSRGKEAKMHPTITFE